MRRATRRVPDELAVLSLEKGGLLRAFTAGAFVADPAVSPSGRFVAAMLERGVVLGRLRAALRASSAPAWLSLGVLVTPLEGGYTAAAGPRFAW